jgi:hypothetical protein
LKTLLHTAGIGMQGRSRSVEQNAVALRHVAAYSSLGLSLDASIKTAAAAECTSPHTLRAALQQFGCTSELIPPATAHRGRGNPNHPLHFQNTENYGPSFQAELLMHELIHKQKTEGVTITSVHIKAELLARLSIDVHRSTIRRWLYALGYRWRYKRYVGGMKPHAKNARIRQFVLEYAAALKEEEAGTAVVVYMDESFIYAHHSNRRGWFHPSDRDVIGDSDGKRLIVLHAMTDRGLLAVPDAVASNWMSEAALTCEVVFDEVFEDGQDDSDYHNTMTGAKFTAWVRNRLLPTFKHMYPRKKMFLVLDNAPYHRVQSELWVKANNSMNKHDLAHELMDLGVERLTTIGPHPRVVESHKFELKVGDGGCSKEDLIAAIDQWLTEHPNHNRTVVEQLMDDAGHTLVYTPPWCPEVQPIELLWAAVKRYVANHSTLGRSMTLAREHTEEGFETITKMFCNSIIKHCHDWIDSFLQTEAADDLQQCGTLAGVMKHLSLLQAASTVAPEIPPAPPIHIPAPLAPAAAASAAPLRNLRKRH